MKNLTLKLKMDNLTETERQELIRLVTKCNDACVNQDFVEDDIFSFNVGDTGYFINTDGNVYFKKYENTKSCDGLVKNHNLCKSENYMRRLALQQLLYRKLKQYSYQHGGKDLLKSQDSSEQRNCVYYIYAHKYIDKFECNVGWDFCPNTFGVAYFCSDDVAKQAIDEVVKPFLQEHGIDIDYFFD